MKLEVEAGSRGLQGQTDPLRVAVPRWLHGTGKGCDMTDPKYVIDAIVSDDPADVLMDILVKADKLGGLEERDPRLGPDDDATKLGVLVCSVSPLWKQATAALSTGPLQYASHAVDRAKNQVKLVQALKQHLEGYLIKMPPHPPQYTVKRLLDEAHVKWEERTRA